MHHALPFDLEPLFSESHARFIVTAKKENADEVISLCKNNNVHASQMGEVSEDGTMTLFYKNRVIANCKVDRMEEYWKETIPKSMGIVSS